MGATTTPQAKRYVLRLLGHDGRLVGTRYHLSYQAVGNMAAVSIPQAEMRRLFLEYGGNTQAMLAPMSEALNAKGYTTLMVLPAQAQIVELAEVPCEPTAVGNGRTWQDVFDEAAQLELESAKLMHEAVATLTRLAAFLRSTMDRGEAGSLAPHVDDLARRVAERYVAKG